MRGSGASFSGERADEALKDMRSKVSSSGEAGWKAPVPKSHKEEVGAAFQSAHNSSGWDRKARWQRAVNLAKAKMGISGPDESIDKWGPASKDGAAAEDPDRRRASTPLNRRGSMTGVPDGLGGLGGGRGGVHGIAELRTPVALKEHLKRGKGVRESGGGIQLATLEVAWEAPLCEEDAAALVEKWENRRQMLGAAPMSPSRGPLMSPADRALRAWTNNNTPGSGTDNSGGPGTPASGGAVAASSNNSPAALTAAAAAAGRGIVQLRRFSETGSASVAGSGGSFPSMRRSGVFDSIIARRQPQLLEGAAAGGPGVGSSPAELAAGATAADGSPVRYASPVHRQDSGGAGGGLVGNSAPGEMDTPRMRLRISADGGGGRGPPPLMAPPTFGRQRLQPLAAEGSGLNLGLGASPPLPPIPPPIVERSGSIQRELSLGGEPSEPALRTLSAPVPEAPPPAPPPPPALMPVPPPVAPPALQLDSPSGGGAGGGAGGRRHRMSRTSLPGDVGGLPNSSSGGAPGVVGLAAPTSASLPSPLPTLPDEDCPVPAEQAKAEPGPPPPAPEPAPPVPAPAPAPAPPRLSSAHGPLRPTAPASPSLGRYSTSGAPPHPHPHGPPHGPLVPPSPPRQHSPAASTARRSPHQAANLVLAAAGGGGGGGMAGGGLNVQGTGLSMRPGHNLPHPLQHVAAAGGSGGGFSGGGSPALGSPASSSPMRLSHANLPPRLSVNGNLQSSFGSTGSGGGGGGGGGAAAAGPMAVSISAFGSGGGAGAGAATPGTAGVTTGGSDYCLDPAVSSPAGSGVVPPLPLGGGGHRQPAAAENLLTGLRAVAAEAADEMVREAELAAAQRAAALSGRARAAAATAGLNTNLNGLRMSDTGSASGRGARLAGAPQFPGDPWRKFN